MFTDVSLDALRRLARADGFPELRLALVLMLREDLDNDSAAPRIRLEIRRRLIRLQNRSDGESRFQQTAIGAHFRERRGRLFRIVNPDKARSKATQPIRATVIAISLTA